jgi:hypothetical protein
MTAWELEDGDPGTAFAPAPEVKDQGASEPSDTPEWVEEERFVAVWTNGERWVSSTRRDAEWDLRRSPSGWTVSGVEREVRRVTAWTVVP